MGRRPASTAMKVLRGNPGQRRLNTHEPEPPAGEVRIPPGLSAGAVRVWEQYAPVCVQMGTLSRADVLAFVTLCELEATLAIGRQWKASPDTVADGVKLEKEFAPIVRQYYALFGLEPVSRARIVVPKTKPDTPAAKWAGILK